jgi:ribonuclease I
MQVLPCVMRLQHKRDKTVPWPTFGQAFKPALSPRSGFMKKLYAVIAILAITFGNIGLSSARQSQQGKAPVESVAGVFDYYLLTLSWSPTFCLTHKDDAQCSGKGYGFVLHGLWPQYAKGGWP